jgi:hypothetical protein
MLRHAVGERRRHHAPDHIAHALRDELGIEMIRADQTVRAVLLDLTDRNDDAVRAAQVLLGLLPGGERKLHAASPFVTATG